MKFGDHRYFNGQPITMIQPIAVQGQSGAEWYYVDGHVDLFRVSFDELLPPKQED